VYDKHTEKIAGSKITIYELTLFGRWFFSQIPQKQTTFTQFKKAMKHPLILRHALKQRNPKLGSRENTVKHQSPTWKKAATNPIFTVPLSLFTDES